MVASVAGTVVLGAVGSVVDESTRFGPEEGSEVGPESFLKQPVNMVAHRNAAAVALTKRIILRESVFPKG